MNVLVTTDIFPPDAGGPATSVPVLAGALTRRGHHVTVVTWSQVRQLPEDAAYTFTLDRVPRLASRAARVARLMRRLRRHLRRADVVYVNGLLFPTFLANRCPRRPAAAKVVGDLAWEYARNHGLSGEDIDDFQPRPQPPAVEWRRRLRARALAGMDAVIVPSHYLARLVVGWGVQAGRVRVIANASAAGETLEAPAATPAAPRVVTVCRLVAWKGVDTLIDAVATVPGVDLLVVGDGPERAALASRARQRGCGERVTFAGTLGRAETRARLAGSRVFVLASRYEGFPHVVLEAHAAGVPVVAAAATGTPEVVTHGANGLLVPPGDAAALAGALRLVLDDEALRRRLVEGGRATLGRYTLAAMVDQTESVLASLAGPPAPVTAR